MASSGFYTHCLRYTNSNFFFFLILSRFKMSITIWSEWDFNLPTNGVVNCSQLLLLYKYCGFPSSESAFVHVK